MSHKYNFAPGPGILPEPVLEEARKALHNWQNTGCSIIEIPHRDPKIIAVVQSAEARLRELLKIPSNYQVLFLPFPARTLFAMIPLNFLHNERGLYLVSGIWSQMAFMEASRLKKALSITPFCGSSTQCIEEGAYLYFTPNETIEGIKTSRPTTSLPVIADMTSCFLTENLDVSSYGLIFAGAQKNISLPGLTIAILNKELLKTPEGVAIPTMLDFNTYIVHQSMYATIPVFNIFIAGLMFKWLKSQGGIEVIAELNIIKANKLYEFINNEKFYHCSVKDYQKSHVNICFDLPNKFLHELFIKEAYKAGLLYLQGHKKVGGIRASLYNAMPVEGVDKLISFMKNFAIKER